MASFNTRSLLKVLAGFVALVALALLAFYIYLSTRPPAKTVRSLGTLSISKPFRFTRPFIDYMTLRGQRLYVALASHNLVGVIDTSTGSAVATIGGLPRVHGVAIVPELNLAFASAGENNTIGGFDLESNGLVKQIPGGTDPDAIICDEKLKLVYVADHDGKTGTFIDPVTEKVTATVALGGEPEYCQANPDSGLIYQNLEDTSEVVVVDPQHGSVIRRYELAPGKGPTGLAFDAANHRLFSTASNKKLMILNSDTGEIVADLPIGLGVDGAAYDPMLRRVYTANGLGTMTVIQQDSADRYHVLEDAPTHFGGHSLVIDPMTHRIYVAFFGSVAIYEPISTK